MASTNDGFNSLDPLGPEYGRINAPTIDSKGLAAFEGDKISTPKINFPSQDKFFPTLPGLDSLSQPQQNVRKTLVQQPPNKTGVPKNANFQDIKNALRSDIQAKVQSNQDTNSYAKIYSYDAGPDGNAFYKRYNAYGQEAFDKIGFSPLRDNEALFNSRTSKVDDFSRMMKHSFIPLFGRGFGSGWKSMGKMLQGDFTSSDLEDAEAYTSAAAIGQSSKGGVFGFTNNLVMNFGYSAGIMAEAITEEALGVLLAPETMGGSFFLTSANFLKNTSKAVKGIDMAVDGYKAVNTTLKSVESVSNARKFWEAAKRTGTGSLSPFQNTAYAIKGLGETVQKGEQLYNLTNLAKAYKTAGGFYKDVRSINMALSESRLEAGMVENQVYDNLYNKYYRDNGKAPDNDVQYDMFKQSKEASLSTLKWNTALIYASNAITFPNIVGPKGGIPSFMRNTAKELQQVSSGKFGKLGSVVYDQGKKQFNFKKNNFINYVKDWGRQPIYKSAKNTVGYFKGNFSEGIQESMQEIVSGANEKYYTDTFDSPALKSNIYSKAVDSLANKSKLDFFKEEARNQLTGRGFETFASGFAMGAIASPVNNSVEFLSTGYNKLFNKEAYREFKQQKTAIMENLVSNLNSIDINEFLNARPFNYGVQDLVSGVKENGSKKEAVDATDEAFLKQMDTLIQKGGLDMFRVKLEDLKQLTPAELEENIPNIPKGEGEKYLTKIDDVINKTKRIEKRYNFYNEKFPNPITQENLPPKNTPEYEDAVALHHAWNKATENAVYFGETFDYTMQRKADVLQNFITKKPFKNMTQSDAEVLFDYGKLKNEIALLKDQVKVFDGLELDERTKEDFEKKKRKLAALEKLGESTAKYRNFFNRYEKAGLVKEELQKQKGDVPVTDEEVDEVLNKFFGDFTEDNKIEKFSEYEGAYRDYLKTIAGLSDDFVFDKDLDESFNLLADHQKLDSEAKQIMKYVNLLHDPGGFLDLVDRNRKWMKDLYARRGSVYEKIVKDEFGIVVDNALLNALANKGIYISLEDFEAWKKDGTPPSEFYDHEAKMIIPEGTEQYEEYYMLFEQASEIKSEPTTNLPESLDAELKKLLDKLEEQKQEAIDALPKKEVEKTIDTLESNDGSGIPFTKLPEIMVPDSFAEVDYGGEYPLLFYMDADSNIKLDSKDGADFDPTTAAIEFTKARVYTLREEPDPELVKPIEEKFERYREQIINDFNNRKAEAPTSKEPSIVSSDTRPEDMDPVLYNKLYELFDKKYLSKLTEEEDMELGFDAEKMRNAFVKFLQSDREAKQIIEEYNKSLKLEETTKELGEKEDFKFVYQGKQIDTSTKSLPQLRVFQRRLNKLIKEINAIKEPTAEDIANKNNYTIVVNDLEKLIATRAKKGMTPELQEAIAKIQELKEQQGEIVQSPAGYQIDGEVYQRVTKVIQDLKGEKYEYTGAKDVSTAFYLTIGSYPLTTDNIAAFIQELRSRNLPGFSEFTYNELQKELDDVLDVQTEDSESTGEKLLTNIQKIVSEKTYEESRISGNYIDEQIKRLFEGDKPIEFDEKNITQEAFDELFGDKGYLTALKKRVDNGEIYVVSQGLRVFDKELKIAGEIDLLVADTAGNITIVDVKTGEKSKWDNFKKVGNKNSKMEDYQLQQTAYANLLTRMIGYNPNIALLPIQMVREKETGRITSASKPTSPTLLSSDFLISLSKKEVQERINSIIPLPDSGISSMPTPAVSIIPEDAESSDDTSSPTQDAASNDSAYLNPEIEFTLKDFQKELDKVTTLEQMTDLKSLLHSKVVEGAISFDNLKTMAELINNKVEEINNNAIKIVPTSVKKDDQFVAKTTIFTPTKEVFAKENDTVIINSVNEKNKTVNVSNLGTSENQDISFDNLNNLFNIKEVVMGATNPTETPISTEGKSMVDKSIDLIESLIQNKDGELDRIEKETIGKSIDKLDKELLEDLDC